MNKAKENFNFRQANENDMDLIIYFIKALAEYEKMLDQIVFDDFELKNWLFIKNAAKVIFVLDNAKEVGFALYFYNFSTFKGRSGIYIEDLFVLPEFRGKGFGIALFRKIGKIALDNKMTRLEWACLDWNKSSIAMYLALGAVMLDDRRNYRLDDKKLLLLVNGELV